MSFSRLRSSLASASPAYLALSCFGLAASPALAQQQDADGKAVNLGGVTVTDTAIDDSIKVDAVSSPKFTQPLQDTPQTIQVIRKELFNQQGATTLTEALRNSAGVGTFYAGENGNTTTGDAIRMRGFDTTNSIFVDGVRDLGAISRDIFNTDQVEVTKGPAGTDNGRTAPTGAINMVSKRANLEQSGSAIVSAGVDGQKRANADLNLPIEALPNTAFRLNAVWQDSDVPGRDHVNNSREGLAASIGTGIGTDTRVFLNLLHVNQHNIPDGFVPTIGLDIWEPAGASQNALIGNPVDSSNFYGTRDDHDDVKAQMATLIVEHDVGDILKITNTTRWGQTSQDYLLTHFMATTANVVGNGSDLSSYTINRQNTIIDRKNEIITNQFNVRANFGTGGIEHNLSAGVELTREKYTNWRYTSTSRPAANLYDPDWNDTNTTFTYYRNGTVNRGQTDTMAFYIFDTAKLFDDLLLVTGGVRIDDYKTTYVTTGETPLKKSGTLFNWKLGAVLKPIEPVSLYVNYAVSQQPPGGDNFQLNASDTNANYPNMKPQKTETYEAGVKWNALGGRLFVNAAVFQTKVDNEINTSDSTNIQSGSKRVRGVELSLVGNITDAWQLSAGYSFQKTKVTNGTYLAADGTDVLTYAPQDAFTSWTTYRLPFGLELGGGARYTGGLHRGTDSAIGTPKLTEGYWVVDAIASYAVTDKIKLRVNAYNLFDKEYIASINKSGYRYSPGQPRTVLFSVDAGF